MLNGIRRESPYKSGTEAQENKYRDDADDCGTVHLDSVETLYEMQIGNPELYSPPPEAAADCLRKAKVVKMSYTGKDLAG